jgi:hypothetical protein
VRPDGNGNGNGNGDGHGDGYGYGDGNGDGDGNGNGYGYGDGDGDGNGDGYGNGYDLLQTTTTEPARSLTLGDDSARSPDAGLRFVEILQLVARPEDFSRANRIALADIQRDSAESEHVMRRDARRERLVEPRLETAPLKHRERHLGLPEVEKSGHDSRSVRIHQPASRWRSTQ